MYSCQDVRFVYTAFCNKVQIHNVSVIYLRLNPLNCTLPIDFAPAVQTMLDLVFRIVAMSNEVLYDILIREDGKSSLILAATCPILTFTLATESLQNSDKPQDIFSDGVVSV